MCNRWAWQADWCNENRLSPWIHENWQKAEIAYDKMVKEMQMSIGSLGEIEQQIQELQYKKAALVDRNNELLADCEEYIHGCLSGIRNSEELVSFLNKNKHWVCRMMGWSHE